VGQARLGGGNAETLQGERRTPNAEAVEELSVFPSASQLHSIEFATKSATKFGMDALEDKSQLSHVRDRQRALREDGHARFRSVLNQAFGDDRRNIRRFVLRLWPVEAVDKRVEAGHGFGP
jgi:hypothetical protein